MKINKSTIITTLGIMALAFAFFTIAPVVNANHCNNNCNDNYNEINNKVVIEYVDKKFPPVTGTCSVDVSRAVRELIASPQLRSELSNMSYQQAQQYSWQRCANETFRFLVTITKN